MTLATLLWTIFGFDLVTTNRGIAIVQKETNSSWFSSAQDDSLKASVS